MMAMSQKNYEMFARVLGKSFAACGDNFKMREFVYENVYTPLADELEKDNPLFDRTRFSFKTAVAEGDIERAERIKESLRNQG
jgi:hypothetical protein